MENKKQIRQLTIHSDETRCVPISQPTKEEAHDYHYFTEQDLPPLKFNSKEINLIKKALPELPQARRKRFEKEYKLPESDIQTLVTNKALADYFEQAITELKSWLKAQKGKVSKRDEQKLVKLSANYIITELQKLLFKSSKDISQVKISQENFAEFIKLIHQGEISSSAAQALLAEMFKTGTDPSIILDQKDLRQVSDGKELAKAVDKVIKENSKPVTDYKGGKQMALQFLVGQVMRETKGKANPQVVAKILREKLTG